MNHRGHQRGQVMLIILGSMLLGGGAVTGAFTVGKSIEALKKDTRHLEIGATRRAEVLDLLDRWDAISEPAVKAFEDYGHALVKLLRQQQAAPEQFHALMEGQRDSARNAEDRLLPLRDELRATLSRDEWDQLFR